MRHLPGGISIRVNDPALSDVLRLSARVHFSGGDYQPLVDAAARLTAWQELPSAAEAHGLAPLLYAHFKQAGIAVPVEIRQQLLGLVIAHREANRVRFDVLGQMLGAFESADLPVIVLKGAALAHLLYPSVGLRPLSDLDLLVDPRMAARAQSVLESLGFRISLPPRGRRPEAHHHLPAAVKRCGGCEVRVEIHTNALTRDTPASLSMEELSEAPQEFLIEGRTARALGHMDMLYHLCRHTAERGLLLRLIWVADLVGYATRYREAIDWVDLRRRYPFVPNALSLMHLITPLPDSLVEHVKPARGQRLRGVGVVCKPLSAILTRNRPVRDIWRDLFDPSDWWLRVYYEVDRDSSLWWYRWVRHPAQVGFWLARRTVASLQGSA
jgi:hypothetical protein